MKENFKNCERCKLKIKLFESWHYNNHKVILPSKNERPDRVGARVTLEGILF